MSSKLFRAVVGLGISIGSAAAACDGVVDNAPLAGDASAGGDASTSPDAPPPTDGAVAVDVQAADVDTADVADVADAGGLDVVDADAIADAFCDFTWPTTKGSVILPNCIDPSGVCWDSGMPIRCMTALGPHQCDIATSGVASSCRVDAGSWACPVGTMPMDQCWCYGELGDGQVCTDAGPSVADAADQ